MAISSALRAAYDRALTQSNANLALAADDALLTKKVDRISHWTVAQHLEHIALVNLGIITRVHEALKTTPENSSGRVSLLGCVVLWTGTIPRGRGKAPVPTMPQLTSFEDVRKKLTAARETLVALEAQLPEVQTARGRSPHPALGMFTAAHWVRFIPIHTHHHDKIVHEIRHA